MVRGVTGRAPKPFLNMPLKIDTAKDTAFRISAGRAMREAGFTIEELMDESVVPACCSDGCMVEPDGTCPHGCPSVLLECGLI